MEIRAMEYQVVIQRQVWSGKTAEESEHYGLLHKHMVLPFVPFVGLEIWVGLPEYALANQAQKAITLVSVGWSSEDECFYCMDRDWFEGDLKNYKREDVNIKEYLEEEVAVFWDKFGLGATSL